MRYFLDISYVGTRYAGWQVQHNALGIQEVVSKALTTLLRQPTECFASGRTDAGVHALQQIVQFDTEQEIDPFRWLLQLNSLLPNDIVANGIRKVKLGTSARFDAVSRTYYYKVSPKRNPFLQERVLYLFKPLDVQRMNEAAHLLLQHEDFEAFSKVHTDVSHFRCQITKAVWEEREDLLVFTICANRFLRGMVRAIVGTLVDVGMGKITVDQLVAILESKDRRRAGQSVSADGLYLARVDYPEEVYIIQ